MPRKKETLAPPVAPIEKPLSSAKKPATEKPKRSRVKAQVAEVDSKPKVVTRRKAVVKDPPAEAAATIPVATKGKRQLVGRVSRTKAAKATATEDAAPLVSARTPTSKPTKEPRRKATKPKAVAFNEDEEVLPVLEWRTPGIRSKPQAASSESPGPLATRRPRRGRGKAEADEPMRVPAEGSDAGSDEELEVKVVFRSRGRRAEAPKPEPEAPRAPVKPSISIPEDAPQVVVRNGVPLLVRNKRVYPPMMFFGNSMDERRAGTVQDEIKLAGESGIHIHSHFLDFEIAPEAIAANATAAAYLLARTLESDPDAQVLFRIVFAPPRNWEQTYTKGRFLTAEGTLADPSVCDDEFWGVAAQGLTEFIQRLRLLPQADRILGLSLDRAEWFFPQGGGYDTSLAALQGFRNWAQTRYSNDEVTLRASWFDGSARFDNITIPEYRPEGVEGEKFVRSSRKQRRHVDYHLFLSDATMARIADLAYTVKAASEGYFLVGVSYGYTFEWSHPANGHLAVGKLLRTPEVDFIAGPPSYRNREPGGSAPFPGPIDSIALNGKLFISEEDFKTSLSAGHEPDDFNPVIKTPQALDSVHWRGAGAALAHGAGVSWMDLWGNGWLRTASIWERGQAIFDALTLRMGAPMRDPDVVVFIDERALAYLVDPNAFTLLVQSVRESVLRSGLSAGFYLLSDLAHREKFPEAKLYLFLNAWDLRPEVRAAIKNRLQRDNKVLFWLYAAGLFDGGRESLERAREVTGIALKPQPYHSKSGTTLLNRRHPLTEAFAERGLIAESKLEPSYFAIPEEAVVLGEYTHTGLPSFVVRNFDGAGDPSLAWKSIFLGEPAVTPALIRALGQMAGAHVFDFHEDVVHVGLPFLTVHCAQAGPRTITIPPNWAGYSLLSRDYVPTDGNSIRFTALEGSSHSFLVGTREELETLLNKPFEELLRLEELPPKSPDTLRQDGVAFDIAMMKLGEWIEGGVSDEAAEDWLLRPPIVEVEETAQESFREGRRRRRRGPGHGDRGGSEEVVSGRHEVVAVKSPGDEDFEINVTFRKRE